MRLADHLDGKTVAVKVTGLVGWRDHVKEYYWVGYGAGNLVHRLVQMWTKKLLDGRSVVELAHRWV